MHPRVDPAALLIAVLAVGVGPITTSGPWAPINSILALVVTSIVVCFTWPTKLGLAGGERFDTRMAVAQSLTYGFIAVTFFGWFIQSILQKNSSRTPQGCSAWAPDRAACVTPGDASALGDLPLYATYIGCGVGVIVAIFLGIVLRRRYVRPTATTA